MVDADIGDVVDLMEDVESRGAGEGRLELARQVGDLRVAQVGVVDRPGRLGWVDDLLRLDAGHR